MSATRHSAAGGDLYARLARIPPLELLAARLGVPRPPELQRDTAHPRGRLALGFARGGRLGRVLEEMLDSIAGGEVDAMRSPNGSKPSARALVYDATGIVHSEQLEQLHGFFHPLVDSLEANGRVLVLGTPPESAEGAREQVAQRALEGFTRSLGKELGRRGTTVQLLYVAPGAERGMQSTLRFLLSPKSAYVSGQVIRLSPVPDAFDAGGFDWERPLSGRSALVTGAARGIGAAIARTLVDQGARVVGLDVPAAAQELSTTMAHIGGEPLMLDITSPDAPATLAGRFSEGLDVLVHNAGVTVDRTLARMKRERWCKVLEINLSCQERINDELLARGTVGRGGRIVCLSSIAGIAGNAGQTNYATSKAGVIGMVQALAPQLAAERGATVNAVAPGFIETQMTRQMPLALREVGRRMNSLLQGGLPVDVAETVAWLASPASSAVNGQVVRVCGQSLLGS